jgi:hypothetical protein
MFVSYKFHFSNTIVREMDLGGPGGPKLPAPTILPWSFVRRGCHGQVPVDAARLSGSLGQRLGANLLPNIAAISSIFLSGLSNLHPC